MKNNYSKEDYEIAKSVNLVDYLSNAGYQVKFKGNRVTLEPHDSLFIDKDKNIWYWFAQGIGGNIIDFLVKYENKSVIEAVNELAGNITYERRTYTRYEPIKEEKGEIILPTKNKENKRAWSYLTKTRGIDSEIVNELIKQGYIYENDKGGVVFVSKDKENNVKFACVRSTSQNSSFKQDVKNSNKEYGFKTVGTSERVFVFEAPIDLLTHATVSKMQGKDWRKDNRISLGGVSDKALAQFLKDNSHIKEIFLFLDNDNVGIENAKKIAKKYGNDYKIKIFTSKEKDLNETLLSYNKQKKINQDLKFNDFVKTIKKPFIAPKICSNERLSDFLRNIISKDIEDSTLDYFIKNNLVAETKDRKAVLFIQDENVENIGDFEFDVYNRDFKYTFLGDSENRVFISNNENTDYLFITDNFFELIYIKQLGLNVAFVEDIKNINKYEKINISITNENLLKELDNPNSKINQDLNVLKEKYSINLSISNNLGIYDGLIEKKNSLAEKIKEKKEIVNELNRT